MELKKRALLVGLLFFSILFLGVVYAENHLRDSDAVSDVGDEELFEELEEEHGDCSSGDGGSSDGVTGYVIRGMVS